MLRVIRHSQEICLGITVAHVLQAGMPPSSAGVPPTATPWQLPLPQHHLQHAGTPGGPQLAIARPHTAPLSPWVTRAVVACIAMVLCIHQSTEFGTPAAVTVCPAARQMALTLGQSEVQALLGSSCPFPEATEACLKQRFNQHGAGGRCHGHTTSNV